MDGGVPEFNKPYTLRFRYNDIASLQALFDAHPGRIAAVFLEPMRIDEPADGYLQKVQALCKKNGTVLVFDEMITGFRWHLGGAQKMFGVVPDLSTFGKAVANGFALSVLCGNRDIMRLGSREREKDNVFLLSTTHGAESPALAAAVATMKIYQSEPVIEHLHRQGERLASGMRAAIARHNIGEYVSVMGRPCGLLFGTKGPDKQPSQPFRTLFLQELIQRGVIAPSLVISYSHQDADVDKTIEAIDGALGIYAKAMAEGVEKYLVGKPSNHVYDRK
jgi:glutamate-1-semialdehyde 2,1-aminomutase